MKKRSTLRGISNGFLALAMAISLLNAAKAGEVKQVTIREGKPVLLGEGEPRPLKKNLQLTQSIKVITNGTFTVNDGKPRKLEEGDILDPTGMLTHPNGTVAPVVDHITRKRGRVVISRDGVETVLLREMALPNGVRIKPEGVMMLPNGRLRRMLDGQILNLDGSPFAARDTVTLREGQVFVQKDGAQFAIRRAQSIMMNDGTKVFGDGRVIKRDGETLTLTEGQILTVGGVAFQKR